MEKFSKFLNLILKTLIRNLILAFTSTFSGLKKLISHDLASQIHLLVVLEVQKTKLFHHFMERSGAKKLKFCYLKNEKFKKTGNWSLKRLSGHHW